MYDFKLQFDRKGIPYWSGRYPVADDDRIENVIAPQVKERGYFSKPEFLELCCWKTPRSKPLVESNPEGFIQEITRTALSTPDERLRIEVLTLLTGVNWPTASVLLHFGHSDSYPILDYRALWSLGLGAPQISYTFDFWWAYTKFCRELADLANVTLRVLDRALWQYSKDNQPRK